MYSPVALACVSRCVPLASFVRTTFAPTTAPPLGSTTVPRILPPVLCASAVIVKNIVNATIAAIAKHKIALPAFSKDFIPITPVLEVLDLNRSSRLLVPRKPYYNPANLGDGGQSVKKKEFIVSIGNCRP